MNISRLSQSPAKPQPAPARPLQTQSKPDAELPVPSEGQVAGSDETGSAHSARVASLASHLDTRIQNAIAHGHLSDEQITALKSAAEQFTALMNRISNADFEHTPQRQVRFALGQLQQQLQAILHPQGDPQPQPGSSVLPTGDSGTPPTVDALA